MIHISELYGLQFDQAWVCVAIYSLRFRSKCNLRRSIDYHVVRFGIILFLMLAGLA